MHGASLGTMGLYWQADVSLLIPTALLHSGRLGGFVLLPEHSRLLVCVNVCACSYTRDVCVYVCGNVCMCMHICMSMMCVHVSVCGYLCVCLCAFK